MDNFLYLKVTYATLEGAFQQLGFRISVKETHRLYEHQASGSIHAMPLDIPMDQHVRPAHLSSARHAVVAFKVTDEATLTKLLTKAETEVSVPAQAATNGHAPQRKHAAKSRVPVSTASVDAG